MTIVSRLNCKWHTLSSSPTPSHGATQVRHSVCSRQIRITDKFSSQLRPGMRLPRLFASPHLKFQKGGMKEKIHRKTFFFSQPPPHQNVPNTITVRVIKAKRAILALQRTHAAARHWKARLCGRIARTEISHHGDLRDFQVGFIISKTGDHPNGTVRFVRKTDECGVIQGRLFKTTVVQPT